MDYALRGCEWMVNGTSASVSDVSKQRVDNRSDYWFLVSDLLYPLDRKGLAAWTKPGGRY